ncbi:hypothetical protein [Haloarchaeobius litoreus]|uniref:Transposase n=1 Tax=Haloarchaeobius litoreus TaxID=755306 RepID=A0ABD6DN12_9EURY|nr:hypothetical protein [Haloarchaeobius litoreus]
MILGSDEDEKSEGGGREPNCVEDEIPLDKRKRGKVTTGNQTKTDYAYGRDPVKAQAGKQK